MVRTRKQKSLVLILAREFASNLATPVYIADADGDLVYFNEPAEEIAGRTFAETGEMPIRDWTKLLTPATREGRRLEREETPGGIAFAERRPAHGSMEITGLDGRTRSLEATVFPLFGPDREFHGIMGIFWEQT